MAGKDLLGEAMERYIKLWRSKNYTAIGMRSLAIIAGSAQAIEMFDSTIDSFNALADLVKKSNDEQEVIDAFMDIMIEDDGEEPFSLEKFLSNEE